MKVKVRAKHERLHQVAPSTAESEWKEETRLTFSLSVIEPIADFYSSCFEVFSEVLPADVKVGDEFTVYFELVRK